MHSSAKKIIGKGDAIHLTHPGLGAVALATFLRKKGFAVDVQDWYMESVNVADYALVGISSTFLDFMNVEEITQKVRAQNPNCHIAVGGQISWTYRPEDLLNKIPALDTIVYREGELTFFDLATAIEQESDIGAVNGIIYRKNNEVCWTSAREPMDPLHIAIPDWSLLKRENRVPLLPVETARGCVYNCSFCSEVTYWGKPVRFRSIKDVVEEIERDVTEFGIKTFRFADSCFTAPASRSIEICEALIQRFIKAGVLLQWSSFARVTDLNEKLLSKMKEAGCVAIDIGMESGDESILQSMKKNYTREDIIKAVTTAKNFDILTHCNVVVGFPGETPASIDNTIDILNTAQPNSYHCMQLYVAPNTGLSLNKESFGLIGDRLDWQHSTMTSDDMSEIMPKIVKSVKPSCLFLAGEIASIMLVAAGYTPTEVKMFFHNISFGTTGAKEAQMIKTFLVHEVSPV